jgi:hypothetical protein
MNHEAFFNVIMLLPLVTSLGVCGIGVDIYLFVSRVNHAEHWKTVKTWLGDDDGAEGYCFLCYCLLSFVLVCVRTLGCFPSYLSIDLMMTMQAWPLHL